MLRTRFQLTADQKVIAGGGAIIDRWTGATIIQHYCTAEKQRAGKASPIFVDAERSAGSAISTSHRQLPPPSNYYRTCPLHQRFHIRSLPSTLVGTRHHICQKIYATAILGLKNLRKKSGICDKTSSGQNNVNALK